MKNLIKIIYTISFLDFYNTHFVKSFNFFSDYINHPSKKYFILLKVKYLDGTVYTFHKGLIMKRNSLNAYSDYLDFRLSKKSDVYKYEST